MNSTNPLFDKPGDKPKPVTSYNSQAVELIRSKISTLYANEPDAKEEAAEAEIVKPRSKHQDYMYRLSGSGKSLAQIQTEWHEYYTALPDNEKHEVWQEFYRDHAAAQSARHHPNFGKLQPVHSHTLQANHSAEITPPEPPAKTRTAADIKSRLLKTVSSRSRKPAHHLKSLGFGLAMGVLVLVFTLFGFFNERFIAPFITPSRTVTNTPIIADANAAVGLEPKLIIPKINVEVPVIYDEKSVDEHAVQRALEEGVLHYATTPMPGEQGNPTIFGHSSNNILNKGKYKFAFVLLNRLENGDTFMIEKDGKRYIYKIFEKRIVSPSEVSVLSNRDRPTATLITCDPPGTSINRLVVVGEQISPDPSSNVASSIQTAATQPEILPSDAPTLWSRFWDWISV